MKIIIFLVLSILISVGQSAKILVVFPFFGRSHYILGSSLARGLAEKGHDVTMLSPFAEKNPPKNGTYRDISITGLLEQFQEKMKKDNNNKEMNWFDREDSNPFVTSLFMSFVMPDLFVNLYEHENFKKFINSNEKFDVVIVEQFINDAQKALASHFDAPLIIFCPLGAIHWVNPAVGNPAPLSYIPDIMLEYSSNMSFCERVINTLFYLWEEFLNHVVIFPKQNQFIKKYIPNGPELEDVLYNASLVLLNSHPSINQPVPHVPNMIEIGGFHVKPPKKLPQDLQEFLDGAKDGVIYFSMGSNLQSAQLPVEKREALLKTFAKLKQKVLWKWEEDVLPGQPKNVKLGKWLPQQDILAHPNVKLFITHGGLLSTTETVYHGVPILAIPILGDQKMNAKTAVNNGFGLMLPYSQVSEETLTKNINELLSNSKYRDNAKTRSKLFHDRQVGPMDTAIYWIEYVARHKGAPHLRVAGVDLPWYKYFLLDVIAFISAIVLISLFFTCFIVKRIFKAVFSGKKTAKLKKN